MILAFIAASNINLHNFQRTSATRLALYIFTFWISIKALLSFEIFNFNFIRDLAPYAYYAYLFPLRKLWVISNLNQKRKIEKWLLRSLIFHFVWMAAVSLFPSILNYLPYINENQGIKIFTIRPDFDAVLLAVTAYLAAVKKIAKGNLMSIFLVLVCSILIISQGNRSSSISFALICAIFIATKISKSNTAENSILILILFSIIISILIIIVSDTKVGKKFVGTATVFSAQNGNVTNVDGFGTANARIKSWQLVLNYVNSEPKKIVFGVGFGPDFMTESGALRALVASETGSRALPRQPHNYALNTYARLGIIGFALYLYVCLSLLKCSFNNLGKKEVDLEYICILLFITLVPISLLGVVLESPFGAISLVFSISVILEKLEFGKVD